MVKIIITGCCGRMGNRVLALAKEYPNIEVVGAIEVEGHASLGKEVGGIKISSNLKDVIMNADVIIEFTAPYGTLLHLEIAKQYRTAIVIGTTGLTDEEKKTVKDASNTIPIVMSPNMSIGVNLLFDLVGEVAKKLGRDYDVEIVESHHRDKKDAPSGTAKRLAEIIACVQGNDISNVGLYGRKGNIGQRPKGEIGIHAIRAGDIVGEHTVIFSCIGERIELTHKAHSRDTFALGALKAAKFAYSKVPGLYTMQDVLKG